MSHFYDFTIPYGADVRAALAAELHLASESISDMRLVRRSVDARQKHRGIREVLRVEYALHGDTLAPFSLEHTATGVLLRQSPRCRHRILVVGAGPAGLLCADILSQSGAEVTVIDRGESVEKRAVTVHDFWKNGTLNPESNVQFGEGGAGTFSDGKLTTRIKSEHLPYVLGLLVECGAAENIRWDAKPHVGTDVLRTVIATLRERLRARGVKIHFSTRLDDFSANTRGVDVLTSSFRDTFSHVVLALGNSARDTFAMLHRHIYMEAKPLAVGVRIEHPRDFIDSNQYGHCAATMPAAEYSLKGTFGERGVYSFCMCPGGEVVNASSELGHTVVNGMSYSKRNNYFSNSALVVTVPVEEYGATHPLSGIAYQRAIEEKAFRASGDYTPPAMKVVDFLAKRVGSQHVRASLAVTESIDIRDILPAPLIEPLSAGILQFDRAMPGFTEHGVMIAPETRTSSPVRMPRDPLTGASLGDQGQRIFPCGEGAGYAGGIVSAAVDGVRCALSIIGTIND
ncbi:NAD(P)/FAD-dependent oxidoreductase [Chrysiogenes arsenatis]|uniref:NAD(P)/FAD-dependent oxidoreductase n=1 Tax=Chrysiogenes arsenatis TaxID=309797 RepID=UPI00041EC868|nr:NAD(P)/FAD-dependent oxidoreductase [Chrysiogenes arsenatis]